MYNKYKHVKKIPFVANYVVLICIRTYYMSDIKIKFLSNHKTYDAHVSK